MCSTSTIIALLLITVTRRCNCENEGMLSLELLDHILRHRESSVRDYAYDEAEESPGDTATLRMMRNSSLPTVCVLPNTAREAYLAGLFHKFYSSPDSPSQQHDSHNFTPFNFQLIANLSDVNQTDDRQSVDVAYAINNWLPNAERCTVLVGPKDTAQSLHISPFVNVPWISHGASASPLTNKEVYPFFSRIIPEDSFPAKVMAEFFKQVNWTSVLTLCTDEPYGRSVTNNFIKAYKAKGDGNEVYGGACVNPHTATKEEIQRELVPILVERRTRVLFFGGTASSEHVMTLIREVLMEAGMAEQVILFLSDEWCDGAVRSKSILPGSLCTSYGFKPKKAKGFFDRWIGLNNYHHERETTQTLVDAGWPRSYLQLPEVSYNMVHDIRFSEMMLHDALLHMAAGLTRCVKLGVLRGPGGEASQRSQKAECLAVIRNTTVTGVSGPTTMDVNGDRMGATMHVHNLNPSRVTIGCMQVGTDGSLKPFKRWKGTILYVAGRFLPVDATLPSSSFPLPPNSSERMPVWLISLIPLIACLVVCGLLLLARYVHVRWFRNPDRYLPQNEALPFSIVFTDIQSSTAMWSRLNDAMGDALDAHHRLIRERIRIHKGYEVKTIGDSFMVVFKRASDAVAFCASVQLALHDHVWQPSSFSEFSIFDDFYQGQRREKERQIMRKVKREQKQRSRNNSIRERGGSHHHHHHVTQQSTSSVSASLPPQETGAFGDELRVGSSVSAAQQQLLSNHQKQNQHLPANNTFATDSSVVTSAHAALITTTGQTAGGRTSFPTEQTRAPATNLDALRATLSIHTYHTDEAAVQQHRTTTTTTQHQSVIARRMNSKKTSNNESTTQMKNAHSSEVQVLGGPADGSAAGTEDVSVRGGGNILVAPECSTPTLPCFPNLSLPNTQLRPHPPSLSHPSRSQLSRFDDAAVPPAEAYSVAWNGIRVRMGVHHGHGRIGRDPTTGRHDFKGHAVNLAERMESLAQGGQIIVSEAVLAAAKQEMAFLEKEIYDEQQQHNENKSRRSSTTAGTGETEEDEDLFYLHLPQLKKGTPLMSDKRVCATSLGHLLGSQGGGTEGGDRGRELEIFQLLPERLRSRTFIPPHNHIC